MSIVHLSLTTRYANSVLTQSVKPMEGNVGEANLRLLNNNQPFIEKLAYAENLTRLLTTPRKPDLHVTSGMLFFDPKKFPAQILAGITFAYYRPCTTVGFDRDIKPSVLNEAINELLTNLNAKFPNREITNVTEQCKNLYGDLFEKHRNLFIISAKLF